MFLICFSILGFIAAAYFTFLLISGCMLVLIVMIQGNNPFKKDTWIITVKNL